MLYVDFVTYKGNLEGIKTLYVKMDGKNGTVLKVNNKYLRKRAVIKNNRNFSYGFYLIKYEIKNVKEKNGFITVNGKILGYRKSNLNNVRKYISNIFDELFITEKNLHAFSKAALLGEKSYISEDMNDKFKYTGLAHLTVISGTHISLVIMGIIKILDSINTGYRMKYIFALTVLTFYCTVVGMSSGILRAYIMGVMMILARIFFEQEDSKKSLLISGIITVVLNPYSIFDISFQLSYMAVIGIIFVYPVFEKMFQERYFDKIQNGLRKNILEMLLLSLTVQITVTPLFIYYFDKLPLFSFLLNTIGVPLGTVLIELLFGAAFLNMLKISVLNPVLIIVSKIVYNAFEGFIYIGSRLPFFQIEISVKSDIYFIIIYYVILLTIMFCIRIYLQKD